MHTCGNGELACVGPSRLPDRGSLDPPTHWLNAIGDMVQCRSQQLYCNRDISSR